jgi:WD40 repeat protein
MRSAVDGPVFVSTIVLIGLATTALAGSCHPRAPLASPAPAAPPAAPSAKAPPRAAPSYPPLHLGPPARACALEPAPPASPAERGAPVLVLQEARTEAWPPPLWNPVNQLVVATQGHTFALWDGASGELRGTLDHAPESLTLAAWSPDGTELAGVGAHELTIWSLATGGVRRSWRIPGASRSLVWSSDGAVIASLGEDDHLRAWSPTTGAQLADHWLVDNTQGWESPDVSWSADGSLLAMCSHQDGKIRIWDVATGTLTRTLEAGRGSIGAAFKPTGSTLASWDRDGAVRLWDVTRGEVKSALSGLARPFEATVWSPEGSYIVSADEAGTARRWSPDAGSHVVEIPVFRGKVAGPRPRVAVSPSGQWLAVSNYAGVALVGPDRTVVPVDTGSTWGGPTSFSCDGHTLASLEHDAPVFRDAATGARRFPAIASAHVVPVTPNADWSALIAARADGTAVVFDTRRLAQRAVLESTGKAQPNGPPTQETYQFVRGGKSILGDAQRPGPGQHGYEFETVLRIWSATTGHLGGEHHFISAGLLLSWSPDGRMVGVREQVYGSPSTRGNITLLRGDDMALLGTVDTGSQTLDQIAWSPDGSAIAVLGKEIAPGASPPREPTTITVWDAKTRALRTRIDPSRLGTASGIHWSLDSASLVIVCAAPDSPAVQGRQGKDQDTLWNARTGAFQDQAPRDENRPWARTYPPPEPPAAFTMVDSALYPDLPLTRVADGAQITLRALTTGPGIDLLATTKDGLFEGNPALVRFRLGEDLARSPLVAAKDVEGRQRAGLVRDFLDGKAIERRGE